MRILCILGSEARSRDGEVEAEEHTCTVCGQVLPIGDFERLKDGWLRSTCRKCVMIQRNTAVSGSYELYLRRLLTKSKSSRKNTHEFKLTIDDLMDLWQLQEGRCAVSGVFMTHHADGLGKKEFNASIDRIDGNKDYVRGNVQLVAYRINILKHTLSTDMLYWWVKTIYHHSCD